MSFPVRIVEVMYHFVPNSTSSCDFIVFNFKGLLSCIRWGRGVSATEASLGEGEGGERPLKLRWGGERGERP